MQPIGQVTDIERVLDFARPPEAVARFMLSGRGEGERAMGSAAVSAQPIAGVEPHPCTLLQLVQVLSEITDDEHEVVATVIHMLCSGSVRLIGNFRGVDSKEFL
jgi:hypothetical protein